MDRTIYSPYRRILYIMTVFENNTTQIKILLNSLPAKVGDKKATMLKKMTWLSANLVIIFIFSPFFLLNLDICVSDFLIFIWYNAIKIIMTCPQRRREKVKGNNFATIIFTFPIRIQDDRAYVIAKGNIIANFFDRNFDNWVNIRRLSMKKKKMMRIIVLEDKKNITSGLNVAVPMM